MKSNVGNRERLLRLAAGSAILGYGLLKKNKMVEAIGTWPLVTGLFKYCPVNEMLGMNILSTPAKRAAKKAKKRAGGEDDTGGYRTGKARKSSNHR